MNSVPDKIVVNLQGIHCLLHYRICSKKSLVASVNEHLAKVPMCGFTCNLKSSLFRRKKSAEMKLEFLYKGVVEPVGWLLYQRFSYKFLGYRVSDLDSHSGYACRNIKPLSCT
jgi:hypothetical protein